VRTLKDRLADYIRDTRRDRRLDPDHLDRRAALLEEVAFTTPAVAVDAFLHAADARNRAGELRRKRAARRGATL